MAWNRSYSVFVGIFAGILLVFGLSMPAQAGGITIHFGSGHHYDNHRGHKHRHKHHRRHNRRHGGFRTHRYRNHDRHRYHRSRTFSRAARRPCEQVERIEVDRAGYRRRVGGTMCYDEYGRGFIVPGSRFVISP